MQYSAARPVTLGAPGRLQHRRHVCGCGQRKRLRILSYRCRVAYGEAEELKFIMSCINHQPNT